MIIPTKRSRWVIKLTNVYKNTIYHPFIVLKYETLNINMLSSCFWFFYSKDMLINNRFGIKFVCFSFMFYLLIIYFILCILLLSEFLSVLYYEQKCRWSYSLLYSFSDYLTREFFVCFLFFFSLFCFFFLFFCTKLTFTQTYFHVCRWLDSINGLKVVKRCISSNIFISSLGYSFDTMLSENCSQFHWLVRQTYKPVNYYNILDKSFKT